LNCTRNPCLKPGNHPQLASHLKINITQTNLLPDDLQWVLPLFGVQVGYSQARQPKYTLLANHLKIIIIQTNLLPDDLLKRGVIPGGGSKWGTLKQDNP